MSDVIKVTAPETAAALGHVLDAFSDKIDMALQREIPGMPWAEAAAAERYLLACKQALQDIIAEIIE